jgi:hypothetical protein
MKTTSWKTSVRLVLIVAGTTWRGRLERSPVQAATRATSMGDMLTVARPTRPFSARFRHIGNFLFRLYHCATPLQLNFRNLLLFRKFCDFFK